MEMPQELEIWYVIPAIRKEFVNVFREKGLSQKEIAEILNVSKSAVSQYVNEKRARLFLLNNQIKTEIRKSANDIINKNSSLMKEIQRICTLIRKSKILCELHKKRCKMIEECDVCLK